MLHSRNTSVEQPLVAHLLRQKIVRYSIVLAWCFSLAAGATGAFFLQHAPSPVHAATPPPLGLNIDFNEQSLVDMIQNEPRFQQVDNTTTALTQDTNGWPTSDFEEIIDNRYNYAWVSGAVNIDPQKASTDISGTYKLSFTGQAVLTSADAGDPSHAGTTVSNQQYNSATNTTTADVTLSNPSGGIVVDLQFTQTKRNPTDAPGTGVTNVKMIRPGYASTPNQVFTNEWLSTLTNHNWTAFRFMGALGTNDYADPATDGHPYSELYPYRLQWSTDRRLPNAGPLYGAAHPGVHGVPWEYVVLIAQITHKDIWINIPVNASDDYVNQVANLLKNGNSFTGNQGIPSNVNVYVEYSNEMWHYGFHQGPWNNQAAQDEVAAGGSNLNYDNCNNNNDCWRFRRIAKRTLEIGNQFKTAFSDNGTRIRPVINNAFTDHDTDMLTYVNANYGTVSNSIYGISQTGYYGSADKSSVDAIINGETAASDANKAGYVTSRTIANQFGIHSLVYEGGQDEEGNKTPISPVDTTLANQFAAARDPRMQQVEVHDVVTNWFGSGGELYMQFAHVGRFSTYGMWGLSDDVNNQTTGKWKGVDQILGTSVTPTPTPTPNPTQTPTPTPTPNPGLPSPWQTQDIGSVGQTGSASYTNGTFTVVGSGSDIWGGNDGFRYVYQPLNGDGTIIAKVTGVQNTDGWAKAGVMIRETLTDSSTHAFMALTSSNGAAFQRRTTTSGSSSNTNNGTTTAPYWVKLVRSGTTFTGSISSDGSTWTQIGSDTVTMGSNAYVGLAVTAHNSSLLNSSTFTNVSVSTGGTGGGGSLLASDPFSGSTGALHGQNTGTGWSGAWAEQNGKTTVPGYNVSSGSALSFSTLQTSGNYATGGLSYESAGRSLNVSATGPFSSYLTNGQIGQLGSTLWVSTLLRKDANDDQENSLTFHNSSTNWCSGCASSSISVGYFGSASNSGGLRYWGVKLGGTVFKSNVQVQVGQTALLVMRIDFSPNTSASLYVNPSSLGNSAPSSANAQATSNLAVTFQSLAYYGGDGSNQSSLDEIRIGTSYAAVTPSN
ncbi:hypothetical protein [Tengunoibacter tsumagoiensis]|uniref:DUF1349 domain-containing protein n=1 Tax=Tengunoibacter tsumagoiensis TaxID=2014871 RepID=A0A401ZZP5_9CHLR|nr:hypothetical protein [Tengunoibacter tsumagoiensis]GCE12262.1 hypothetical protein KTT_21210 [Tengunoibacter tsumagoiensis]